MMVGIYFKRILDQLIQWKRSLVVKVSVGKTDCDIKTLTPEAAN